MRKCYLRNCRPKSFPDPLSCVIPASLYCSELTAAQLRHVISSVSKLNNDVIEAIQSLVRVLWHNLKYGKQRHNNTVNVRVAYHWGALVQPLLAAVEKQYYVLLVCICSFRYPTWISNIFTFGLPCSRRFFHIIS